MIDTVLNLLFRCPHRRLTRPFCPDHPIRPTPQPELRCVWTAASNSSIDLKEMRIGNAIDHSHDTSVVPPNMTQPRKTKVWNFA
jgi:hypothetical protein